MVITLSFGILTPLHAARRSRDSLVRVRNIEVDSIPVFDPAIPGENRWPFTWANALHIRTRDTVIRRLLLVKPGQAVPVDTLDESERLLRAQVFIKDAKITRIPAPNGQTDLLVRTQDSWTLEPQINFGTEGGQNKFSAGYLEENFLGFGKSVSYFYRSDQHGTGHEIEYKDPLFLGTRAQFSTHLEKFTEGDDERVNLTRPFFSLATRAAGGVDYLRDDRLEKIQENGTEINRYNHRYLKINGFGGYRLWGRVDRVQRMNLAFQYEENKYNGVSITNLSKMPDNVTLTGPVAQWNYHQADFIKESYIDKAELVEDINLGHRFTAGSGYYGEGLGSTNNSLPLNATHAFGFGGDSSWFGLADYGASGRYAYTSDVQKGHPANFLYFGDLNLYRHLLTEFPMTGVFHMESAYVQNADASNQLILGGNTGLRGFKNEAYTGNKSVLGNLETRFYIPKEIFHLAYIGGAVFADAGQVQPQGNAFRREDIHTNVGAGFRFALTRGASGHVVRVDFAFAVGPLPNGQQRMVISISTGPAFKRNANTYANYAGTPEL